MQNFDLTVAALLRRGLEAYGSCEVITTTAAGDRRSTFREVGRRAGQLANALRDLGVVGDQRIATFMWNNQEHVEAYYAVPAMGAVLHTLNIRASAEQLTFIANHAEDRVLIVDSDLLDRILPILHDVPTLTDIVVVGIFDSALFDEVELAVHQYDQLIQQYPAEFDWPDLDEYSAASLCYTSGTTGDPKGVAYSHRSTYLHAFGISHRNAYSIGDSDRIMPAVSMFHGNGWGLIHAAFLSGADLILPHNLREPEALVRAMADHDATIAAAVPTVWSDIFRYVGDQELTLPALRQINCGGSPVPRQLMEKCEDLLGVPMLQGWGMTEMSPLGAIARPPGDDRTENKWRYMTMTGRIIPGVEARICGEDGTVLPADGSSLGEIEVRGPWVTGSYYRSDDPSPFHDGWLRTGDIATLDTMGYIKIYDRAKDVIKSGGEWISSPELEELIVGHPAVIDVAVIGIDDDRWGERPLVCLVAKKDVTAEDLRDHVIASGALASWQVPDKWVFLPELPRTSVGKADKRRLKTQQKDGGLRCVVTKRS